MQLSVMDGGADRNRTCDLLIANETLYQLSYDPIQRSDPARIDGSYYAASGDESKSLLTR